MLLVAGPTKLAHAANFRVQVGGSGLSFAPQVVTIRPGDTVTFANLGGFHNVMADNGAFRCARGCDGDGMGGNGGASSTAWQATVAFPNPGTFGYFCEPHGAPGQGMFGRVIVQQSPPPLPVPHGGAVAAALLIAAIAISGAIWFRRGRRGRARPATADR